MRRRSRLVEAITTHARFVLVGCLLATLLFGAGIPALETDTTLEQFRTDTPESEALEYADRRFEERGENTTTVHVVVTDENALERESLLEGLRFQQSLRQDEAIGPTLVENDSTIGVENVVATAIIRLEQADELDDRADDLETRVSHLEERIDGLASALERVGSLQADYEALNDSYAAGEVSDEEYDRRAAAIEADLDATVSNATADLESERAARFERAAATIRAIESEMADLERQRAAGTVTDREYEARMEVLVDDREQAVVDGSRWLFGDELQSLQQEARELEAERDGVERLDRPPLEEQISALERADDDRFDRAVTLVLAEDGPGSAAALRLLPSSYEPGSLESEERLLLVTQSLDRGSGPPGEIGPDIVESQLALEERVLERSEDDMVFGMGLVADEVDRAVADSLVIVGPLALLFVIVALAIAYRDVLDIALGVAGTATVLVWTLGMAGWAGVAFTQVFVAVPVLLIGLSIDYAIHVVMRHREERAGEDDVRTSMAARSRGSQRRSCWSPRRRLSASSQTSSVRSTQSGVRGRERLRHRLRARRLRGRGSGREGRTRRGPRGAGLRPASASDRRGRPRRPNARRRCDRRPESAARRPRLCPAGDRGRRLRGDPRRHHVRRTLVPVRRPSVVDRSAGPLSPASTGCSRRSTCSRSATSARADRCRSCCVATSRRVTPSSESRTRRRVQRRARWCTCSRTANPTCVRPCR
ncbi:MMPL family transporter [Saliphagus sp. GCM10025308]